MKVLTKHFQKQFKFHKELALGTFVNCQSMSWNIAPQHYQGIHIKRISGLPIKYFKFILYCK